MERIWCFTVAVVVLVSGEGPRQNRGIVPADATPLIEPGLYHALLIGIERYDDPAVNDLNHPIEDVERVRRVLVERYTFEYDNVRVLTNPDRQAIFQSFEELGRLPETDNLLIFFAGHGHWDDERQQGYWLPRDARQDNRSNWISNSDIQDYLRGLKTRHILLVSDACFSGGIFKTRDAFIEDRPFQARYALPSRKAMTSGVLRVVPDKSVFVDYLVKRMEENDDPYVGALDLFLRMQDAVINNSPNIPQYGTVHETGDEGGDFIFIRSDGSRPRPPGVYLRGEMIRGTRISARDVVVVGSESQRDDLLSAVDGACLVEDLGEGALVDMTNTGACGDTRAPGVYLRVSLARGGRVEPSSFEVVANSGARREQLVAEVVGACVTQDLEKGALINMANTGKCP